ncbi:VWA domain-containing protein [Planococcus salinus]|uniref:VWA domain-containing protein n=1 Tax=Planococcus salinus TaxID=1848460 RepID=A0A3M8PC23_9BACL|nr:VWA domain-containing protein [Planococcus salinus]RNF40744.1 VWA domain-containing protein [Planococcus salinus]
MELRIDDPWWLLLLVPTVVYFIYLGYTSLQEATKLFKLVFGLRLTAVMLLIFALAAPSIYRPVTEEQVIFLMDRSASLEGMQSTMASWVEGAVENKADHQLAGVYTFAEDFQSLVPVSEEWDSMPTEMTIGQNSHTDLAQALQLALNSGDTSLAMRLVLMTDGNETRSSVIDSLDWLESERLQVDVLPVEQQAGKDVAITEFTTPSSAFPGESLPFSLAIESDREASAELIISMNDEEIDRTEIMLSQGRNLLAYNYPASKEGLLKFEARLEIADDAFLENNAMFSMTEVEGSPEVLVVSGNETSPISDLLDGEKIGITELTASQLPETLSSVLAYDSIIFDNVSGTTVGEQQMNVIEQAVQQFGVGFVMVGGDQSFGLGGYFKTPIERILPVDMEVKGKHELPSLGLIIVMDRSGSMAGMKMELAKEAAARSVELLREDDTVGVIAFDDRPWEILPTEKLADPEDAIDKILSIGPGGGTEIFSSLEEAYGQLEELELQRKHIILLTDGQSATAGDYTSLIEDGKEHNVTLSTVAIGQDADQILLETLADAGAGRFYDVSDASTIPAILSRETMMMSRTYIVDDPFQPIVYESDWSSLFVDGVPEMNAYIATTPKPAASVAAESTEEDPVLASWNYGLGKTIAYTSDSGSWSGGFQAWQNWPAFWNRTVAESFPAFEEIPFTVAKKEQGVYTVEDPTQSSAILNVTVVDEQGNELPSETEPVAPGKVEVTLDADPGLVFFSIANETGAAFKTGLTIPYGDEYRISEPNMSLLRAVAERTGGEVVESLDESFRDIPYSSGTLQPIQRSLVLLGMMLFFLDITLRRFGLKMPSKEAFIKTETKTDAQSNTIEQLIKAKKRN